MDKTNLNYLNYAKDQHLNKALLHNLYKSKGWAFLYLYFAKRFSYDIMVFNKPYRGNMRHVFYGAKIEHALPSATQLNFMHPLLL